MGDPNIGQTQVVVATLAVIAYFIVGLAARYLWRSGRLSTRALVAIVLFDMPVLLTVVMLANGAPLWLLLPVGAIFFGISLLGFRFALSLLPAGPHEIDHTTTMLGFSRPERFVITAVIVLPVLILVAVIGVLGASGRL